jgi:uncharacterized membrane protein YeaQ/YmgE (transglycosylase-associated protein family)
MQKWTRRNLVPDIVALIIWLIAGVSGGMAAGELLKGDYDLGLGNMATGAIGGVVGAQILSLLIPALGGFDVGPIVGQVIGAAASGAVLTVLTGAVRRLGHRKSNVSLPVRAWLDDPSGAALVF